MHDEVVTSKTIGLFLKEDYILAGLTYHHHLLLLPQYYQLYQLPVTTKLYRSTVWSEVVQKPLGVFVSDKQGRIGRKGADQSHFDSSKESAPTLRAYYLSKHSS